MLFVLLSIAAAAATVAGEKITVSIPTLGRVTGIVDERYDDVMIFKGIPYAKAPVGNLRFQPPVYPHPPFGNLSALEFGDSCLQNTTSAALQKGVYLKTSENCLFLNVAAPRNARKLLPVMVWIHGGAYETGSSSLPLYDPVPMVHASNGSVVVVTLNYRLNIFGFLGGTQVGRRSRDGSAGNFGIADQRCAMRWVRDHIDAFFGDGRAVTIFGESAGGNSVMNHLTQPASFDLYRAAIIESGVYDEGASLPAVAQSKYDRVVRSSPTCGNRNDSYACLLELNASTLLKVGLGVTGDGDGWGPVVDGVSLSNTPAQLVANMSYQSRVPVLIGSNRDEMAFWTVSTVSSELNEREFERKLNEFDRFTPEEVREIREIYAGPDSTYAYPSDFGNRSKWWWALTRASTDTVPGLGACGVRWFSRMLVGGRTPHVWGYLFAHPTQSSATRVPSEGPDSNTVAHASEIAYAFGHTDLLATGEEANLAPVFSTYWTNFARTGDPNKPASPSVPWPEYKDRGDTILRIDVPSAGGIRSQSGLRREACDWMEAHYRRRSY